MEQQVPSSVPPQAQPQEQPRLTPEQVEELKRIAKERAIQQVMGQGQHLEHPSPKVLFLFKFLLPCSKTLFTSGDL